MQPSSGLTIVELVSVSAIVAILAATAVPVAQTMVKRQKELELRRGLREIRVAIDDFHAAALRFPGIRQGLLDTVNEEGYPEEIEWLYEGVDIGDAVGTRLKFLRRIPIDPMTGEREWGTRSSRDRPNSLFSDGINIFDVYSLSDSVGLNGVPYREW